MEDSKSNEKIQRKIKLKTLDNKITELTVDSEINIKDLKKIISQKFNNIEIERERLIFKGKQLKDEEKLSDHITKDNEIIHLMFKAIEQTQNNQNINQNNQNTNQNNPNNNLGNTLSNVLSGLLNNTSVMNLTNVIFGNVEGTQNQPIAEIINRSSNPNAGNILLQQEQNRNSNNIRAQTRIININTSQSNQNINNNNNNNNNNQNLNHQNESNNQNLNLSIEKINENNKFPISISQVDKNYEHLLKDTNIKINKAVENIRKDVTPINLPLLNSNQNALTAISRTIRHYCLLLQEITPSLIRLSELMEREQYIINEQDRKNANDLLIKCTDSLSDCSHATENLKKVLKSTIFGNRPNQGYIGILNAISAVPLNINRNNNLNQNTNLNNNNNRNNVNNTNSNNTNINNNNINNNNNNLNNNNLNNNNVNRQNINSQASNSQSGNNENIYGNIMSQFLNPNNLNNLVGMVDNMLTGSGNNRRNNNQQQNQSSGNNLFSNFLNGFMSGLSGLDSSDEENENEDRKEEEKKEEIKKEEKNEEIKKGEIKKEKKSEEIKKEETQKEDEKKEEIKNEITTKKPDLNLLRKLMQSPSTRKSTTLNNLKEVAILNPNKEFELFTNKIISNLTLQEIVNLNLIKISGFTRQRKEIQLLINDISSIKTITELIIERIILDEDSNNKLKQDNNNFDIEKFFNDNLKELIEIILNKEISENEWEDKVKENLVKIIYKFYIELSNIYTSGKDGAKFCLLFNFENILNDLVGEDFVKVMKDYDKNYI